MKQSDQTFANAMQQMSKLMEQVAQSLAKSMEM